MPARAQSRDTIVFSGQLTMTSGHVVSGATVYVKDDVRFGRDVAVREAVIGDDDRFYSTIVANPEALGAYDIYSL